MCLEDSEAPETDGEEALKLTARSSPRQVAAAVSAALENEGLRAVLSGGGCASIHSDGVYQSVDLDFVLQGPAPAAKLDAAMATAGFHRRGNEYFHPKARFYVEFPPGPLGIGHDYAIRPAELHFRGTRILALSPTDSCRDRLASFFHWKDLQGLEAAVKIALRRNVDLEAIRLWAEAERSTARYNQFLEELERAKRRTKTGRPSRRP